MFELLPTHINIFKSIGSVLNKQSSADVWGIGEDFNETVLEIPAAITALHRHDEASQQYDDAIKLTKIFQGHVVKAEAALKYSSTTVNQEKYATAREQYSDALQQANQLASLLNYTDENLKSEMENFYTVKVHGCGEEIDKRSRC